MKKPNLINTIPYYLENGIFKKLDELGMPWTGEIEPEVLDFNYILNHSGEKLVSPQIHKLSVDGVLPEDKLSIIAKVIKAKYYINWKQLWDAFNTQYNSLDNYNLREEETTTDDVSITQEGASNYTEKRDENRSTSGTVSSDSTINDRADNKVFGFNSVDGKNANSSTGSTTTNASNSSTVTDGYTTDNTSATTTDTLSTSDRDINKVRTIKGNSGFYTPQRMLESEIELRKYNLFERVYTDIDKELTIKIY